MPDKETSINAIEDNRIIFFSGAFTEDKVKDVVTRCLKYEYQSPVKDIVMYIDSYGGFVHSFLAIHDVMKISRCKMATICIGKAMSAGAYLLMSGEKGKRFITPNARVMVHQLSAGTFGKLFDMESDVYEYSEVQKILEGMLLKYTKIKKSQVKGIMNRDTFLSAKEALELGIVDHIVTSPKVLSQNINI